MNIIPVILCGGSGTRLWPLSRKSFPKQFVSFLGDESLLHAAFERVGILANRLVEGQSTCIPLGEVHRLTNPGRVPLEIIEVQTGDYLGEDDIVRFEDAFGRVAT